VQFVEDAGLERESVGKLGAHGVASVALIQLGEASVQHGLANNEFTHQIHYGVDAGGVDAQGAFRDRGCSGGYAGSSCSSRAGFGGFRGQGRGLGFENIAEEFVFSGFGSSGALDVQIGDDAGDAAALSDVVLRLAAGKSGLDDIDSSCGGVIFRAQGDDGAASVKHVADQLEGGGVHEAVGVDAQGDVVDGFAAMHGFGDHELLVLGPLKARSSIGSSLRARVGWCT
jgi:hypothetical protein